MASLPTSGDSRQLWIRLLEEAALGRTEGLEELLASEQDVHAPLLRLLTQLDFEQPLAREHWSRIIEHHQRMSRELGRGVSLQLAALDYFQSVHPELRNPKLVEMTTFLATEKSAITDGLTGLHNRQFFDASLRRELKRARRYGLAFSLVLLDLDDFKAVNDEHGHLVGDEVLSRSSGVIQSNVREIDVACRYGGEEFAIILPETSRTGAFIVSERIRLDVRDLFDRDPVGDVRVPLTISGGISIYPTDSNSAEGLLRMADRALYRSKREGKNRITLHADEKRRYPRLDARNVLVFRERRKEEPPSELRSETKNLSRNGALVESRIPLTVGTELEIDIRILRNESKFVLKGRVVRLEEAPEHPGETRYNVGLVFVADTDEDARQLDGLATEIYRPLEHQDARREDVGGLG